MGRVEKINLSFLKANHIYYGFIFKFMLILNIKFNVNFYFKMLFCAVVLRFLLEKHLQCCLAWYTLKN
ncbi:hypothetical protein l11_19250 [Neisseria weaveri LMG 5135]|nr:hypothetical protein l13_19830 [Neisseria weaveri ATCC 51223]EGV35775.1 hypothetical protein l11_19250 [Neisseria weaveri LMG 5135]